MTDEEKAALINRDEEMVQAVMAAIDPYLVDGQMHSWSLTFLLARLLSGLEIPDGDIVTVITEALEIRNALRVAEREHAARH